MERFRFREVVERLPLVLYVDELDSHSTPVYISPQIQLLLGYTQAEWLADPTLFERCLHPDDRERVMAHVRERNRSLTSHPTDEYRLVCRDGRIVWVRDEEVVVERENDTPIAHGYLQDVTAQRHNHTRLELIAALLALAAEELPPQELIRRTADDLAAALGDVAVTFVELTPERMTRPLYTTSDLGLAESLPLIPESLARLERGPLVVDDVLAEPWLEAAWPALTAMGVRAAVDVPLRRGGEIVAVMWFNAAEPRRWTPDDVELLTDVAEQLALVLERAEAREQRLKADAIVGAVSGAAEVFLTATGLDEAMSTLMRSLGVATGATGAYVFENGVRDDGVVTSFRRAGWSVAPKDVDDPRFGHLRPAPHWPRWAEILSSGNSLAAHVRHLPADERDAFSLLDAKSVVAVPIFVAGSWWGFIGFEDCGRERDWSAAEVDALRAAANLIAAAVTQDRAARDLHRRDAILQAVAHSASTLLARGSWRSVAGELLEQLGVATSAGRAYLFQRLPADGSRLRLTQLFEWVADGVPPEIDNPELQDFSLADAGLTRMEQALSSHAVFATTLTEADPAERLLYEAQGIRSIAVVPVVVAGELWGTVGFDDCAEERTWTHAEIDALRTAAGLVAAAIEREQTERSLSEHEQKLGAVFDTALDAIFITDDERRYVDVNPAACAYYGVPREELLGRRVDDFLPPHRLATVEEDWRAYLAGGPIRAEWEVQAADGSQLVAEASAHPHFVPGLHIAFFRDVTERRRLEAELVNAQRLESLGRLAGGIAHDFNNLLTGITGYASLLLERSDADEALRHDAGEIRRAAERAAELTRQLLAFGRRQVLKPQPVDLNAVVREVAPLLDRLLGDDVALELRLAPAVGAVQADPGQLEQVIVNLAVNARDAMPSGGRVTVETTDVAGFVELLVSDTGTGMSEETAAHIFEPFFTTREDGVGLGLASVYGIVTQSGGEVTVVTAPGRGAAFTVRLPVIEAVPLVREQASPAAVRSGSETILLVEDEDVVRELARRVLERHGYTVIACADGAEALTRAENAGTIDLLLTDVVMPGLRGWEVARIVSESRPGIPVLYMSGYAEEALASHAGLAGFELIEKPFAVDVLARRVREALDVPVAA